jgi:hypothetical protein
LSFVFKLKTQLVIGFREKNLIFSLKIVVVITCHWFLCVGLPRKNFPQENSPAGFSGEKPNGAGASQTTSATFPEAGNTTRRQAAGSSLRYETTS